MAEGTTASGSTDGNRKRSRSPSDSEQPKLKRANTGLQASASTKSGNDSSRVVDSTNTAPTVTAVSVNDRDVSMKNNEVDTDTTVNDTAASTPTAADGKADISNLTGQSGDTSADASNSSGTAAGTASSNGSATAPSASIHMRCLIVTQDASIIIGRGGKHVNEIREKSGARVMVSESIPGNPERILNVSGPLDAVSKVLVHFFLEFLIPLLINFVRHSVLLFEELMTSHLMFLLFLEAELLPLSS